MLWPKNWKAVLLAHFVWALLTLGEHTYQWILVEGTSFNDLAWNFFCHCQI